MRLPEPNVFQRWWLTILYLTIALGLMLVAAHFWGVS